MRARRIILGLVAAAALAGCASEPVSAPLRKEAEATQKIGFPTIQANPSAYIGKTVIWGGSIINVTNTASEGSIFILETPFEYGERPQPPEFSHGRFVARHAGLLDPEVYKRGVMITVAGTLAGAETNRVDNASYVYPIVNVRELHVWRREPAYGYGMGGAPLFWNGYGYGPYWPYYGDPYLYPFPYEYPIYYPVTRIPAPQARHH